MLLECELMLLKCKINANTNKNGFLPPTKCLEEVYKYTITKYQLFTKFIYVCGCFKLSLRVLQPY